jgi:tetratricopeptide (TPR) repeat protein
MKRTVTDTRPQSRRQLVEQARRAALDGNWETAIQLNQDIIERSPRDADAYNRLGRALLEFRRVGAAHEAYSNALKIDPANMIARRNLQRLELVHHRRGTDDGSQEQPRESVIPRTSVFIEEVGKTWVDELVNPAPMEELADIYSGEQLQLAVEDGRLIVVRANGQRVGEVEAKTAERMSELMAGGNRYEVFALGLSAASLRVILREVYRDQKQAGRISFPRQISATRAYLRERDLLRQRDEADFLLLDDEDEEIEEDETGAESGDEEDTTEPETDTFIEDTVVVEEEEPTI